MEKPKEFTEPVLSPLHFKSKTKSVWYDLFEWRMSMRHWIIREDWIFYCDYLKCWIKIPKGFIFDGASVPKILHSIINSTDALFYGAICHDWIYRTDQLIICSDDDFGMWCIADNIGKYKADMLLKEVSIQIDDVKFPVIGSYYALRVFGVFAWNRARNRNLKLTSPYPDSLDMILRKGIPV
jgi:hypothetical protein